MEPQIDPSEDPTESGTSMLDGSDIVARLGAVEERLTAHARAENPPGLTEPDPGGTERWEAAQVWGHIAEFVGYWHEQVRTVISSYDGDAVAFGRTKEDAGRLAGIEMGRHAPILESMARVREAIAELKRYLEGLMPAEWNAVGRHPTRGEMDVESIVEAFVVGHLEEHAEQLDGLHSGS